MSKKGLEGLDNKKKIIIIVALVVVIVAALIIFFVSGMKSDQQRASEWNEEHLSEANKESKWEEYSYDEKVKYYKDNFGIDVPEKALNFEEMHKTVNKDIYAWLYIPEIGIDTPVVQHPTDDDYYLNYNLDGSKGYPGGIYSEPGYNKKDFMDPQTVIYGHNMKNGTGFAALHQLEDKATFDKVRYIYVYTENDILVYEIFASREVLSTHALDAPPYNKETLEDFPDFLQTLLSDTDVSGNNKDNHIDKYDFTKDSKILTLCTCLKSGDDRYRYNTYGVLLRKKDS